MKQTARIIRNNIPYTLLSNGTLYAEPLHVPTVADARLLPDPPPLFITIGSAGVSVSGNYYWDSASTDTDDGQNVIKVTAITTGRFKAASVVSSGSSGLAVANIAALKALTGQTDNQLVSVGVPASTWVYSSSTGAGFESDDRTVVRPNSVLLGSNGRWYITDAAPVVPTIAALRLAVSGKHQTINVLAYSEINDGGGGTFDLDTSDTTTADDSGLVIVAGTNRYKRRYSGVISARWFGVKADVKKVYDAATTASSGTLTSATAAFTSADVGKKFVARIPTSPATGTVSGSSNTLTGTGTLFTSEFTLLSDNSPYGGGAVYLDGQWLIIYLISNDTTANVVHPISGTITNKTLYRETQVEGTITGYTSATQVTISHSSALTLSNVEFCWGSDDTSALEDAIIASAVAKKPLVLPTDRGIGMSSNLHFQDYDGIAITGQGKTWTLYDLRKASTEYTYLSTEVYGILTFKNCTNVRIYDYAYDGQVPVLGMTHSTGGTLNATGSRQGITFDSCDHCHVEHTRTARYGARDEYLSSPGRNSYITCNDFETFTNGPGINFASDPTYSPGIRITNGRCGYYGAIELAADDSELVNVFYVGDPTFNIGGDPFILIPYGSMRVLNCGATNVDQHTTSSSIVQVLRGAGYPDAVLELANFHVTGTRSLWSTGVGAAITLNDFMGTTHIHDCTVTDCTDEATGGRMICIDGANSGRTFIHGNRLLGGTNLTSGIKVTSTVPAGQVVVHPDNDFGTSVTTPLELEAAITQQGQTQTISATGTTAVRNDVVTVRVTANGSVTATLPSPVTVGARKRITIVNSTAQTGTTTIGAAAGSILGAATLVGVSKSVTYESNGSDWQCCSQPTLIATSIDRAARGLPFIYEADADIDEYGRVIINTVAGTVVKYSVEVPDGATITSIVLQVIGGGNANLPAVMPLFRLRTLTIASNSTAASSAATDGSANVGVYNAQHAITLSGLSTVVDNSAKRYMVEFISESGANAVTGFNVIACVVSFTTTTIADIGAA